MMLIFNKFDRKNINWVLYPNIYCGEDLDGNKKI